MEINWETSRKQQLALKYLSDDTTTELFYGGVAGGGKSYLGCAWLIISCIEYAGIRCVMGRSRLKTLRESTLLTLFQILKDWGFVKDVDWKYNAMDHVITFWNSSCIYLKDLFTYPSDPDFDNLGSTEYTFAFIDECSEVSLKAKNILMSRLRFKLDEFNVIPKLLMSSNPNKKFLYFDFYKPWKAGKLLKYRKFIPALVTDNPFISPYYIENLKKLDKVSRERLLYGNFEYEDDPSKLFEYDDILDMFTNTPVINPEGPQKFMSVDVARFGDDKTVICCWKDLLCYKIKSFKRTNMKEVQDLIEKTAEEEGIKRSNVVVDEDGLGGGVVDNVKGVKGFINGGSPIVTQVQRSNYKRNFANLKTQCYFELARLVSEGKVGIRCDEILKEGIIEELDAVKQDNIDNDVKLSLIKKDVIKEALGRSPDFGDALMMRMLFEVKPRSSILRVGGRI